MNLQSATLLVLMSSVEHATHPRALANTVKHLALLTVVSWTSDMLDAQIAVLENELLRE
jgi:hypothetical protein